MPIKQPDGWDNDPRRKAMLQRLMDEYRRETGKEPIEDIFRAALLIVDMHANEQIIETLVGGMTAH